jgi:hypothetical protein
MNLVAILVVVLVTPHSSDGMVGRDGSLRVYRGGSGQADAEQEKSQVPATQPATPSSETDQKRSDQKQPENNDAVAAPATTPDQTDSKKPVTAKRKRRTRRKAVPAQTADGEPRKVVIHRGGANEPVAQIVPGVTQEEAARQRESAGQLLVAAESDLKELAARSLKPNQEQLVIQIRQYMDGARSALKESDPQRAHTLALKAYLLSDDLVKH